MSLWEIDKKFFEGWTFLTEHHKCPQNVKNTQKKKRPEVVIPCVSKVSKLYSNTITLTSIFRKMKNLPGSKWPEYNMGLKYEEAD